MSRFSARYIQKLLDSSDVQHLAEIANILSSNPLTDFTLKYYNLPSALFVFIETQTWFAQGSRSGVWTYFEATDKTTQQQMAKALLAFAPKDFYQNYLLGMSHWQDTVFTERLDHWLDTNQERCNVWLVEHLQQYLALFRYHLI
ncbi:hypothetical protein VQ643_07530 [Pseudomonas sp. F1_0610]|uniref:hypothetical protein n=1 Tax=Pseudomonas sp. F1_0610 TaxID=3114284 RepID=UPI0039C1D82E